MIKVLIETDTGTETVEVDPQADLGEITPAEFKTMTEYVARSGIEDIKRAYAGANVVIQILRQTEVDRDQLLEAVLNG